MVQRFTYLLSYEGNEINIDCTLGEDAKVSGSDQNSKMFTKSNIKWNRRFCAYQSMFLILFDRIKLRLSLHEQKRNF